jgi:hypothetical protein
MKVLMKVLNLAMKVRIPVTYLPRIKLLDLSADSQHPHCSA